jgi:hypothetical protein
MPIDRGRARQCLKAFDFRKLFLEELGWDKFSEPLVKAIDGQEYRFYAVAEKRGVVVLVCDSIPEYAVRVKLDKLVAKDHFEHLIVFADKAHGRQVWQWVRKEPGKPTAVRTYHYSAISASGGAGELLLQKLDNLAFTLEEEESVRTGTVTGRLKTFDVEKVTKKFYERFKTEHSGFLGFIKGIPDKQMESWYASVMINRLMFLYFIQEKGFLNADKDYLRNKLAESKDRKRDVYYADFLCPLFFQGFARKKADRSTATNKLLGEIPYLNGGLFQKHQIEELHGKTIIIHDKAFEKLFDFFKEYNWHLDEREDRNDREINPDVLGYIFEKYINQKQMGAYYTKEDITEYISQNTIIPFLLDEARKACAIAFVPEGAVWRLLRDDPDRYIHDAMKKGADLALPSEIEVGVQDVAQRAGWNRTAPEEYALPTEIWREAIDRHQRYRAVKAKLASGEVHEVNDLVTLNLNIRQFAQDVIQFSEGPELLRVIWKAIEKVSVLDPTCGSGAFLFAALNILKPLYEACLIRMQGFIEDNDAVRPKTAEETILAFIRSGESSNLEFKSAARWNIKENKADKTMEQVIVKTVAAFLNSHGGDLLIGVADNGAILGIETDQQLWKPDQRNRDTYENWLTTLLLDAFGKHHTANLHISFARLEENDVCRVSVLPSATAVYVKDGNAEILYVRTGNSTRALTVKEAVAYHQQRFTNPPQPHVEPGKSPISKKYSDFRKVVEESKRHPKQDYFILKAIIVNNLFGVDIMEEAVEICKLRLFLKLVAQVDSQDRIEPLPDIDFNIRTGNTLVGYARYDDVERAVKGKLDFGDAMNRIEDKAKTLDSGVEMFRQQQTELNGTVTSEDKSQLRKRFAELESELNDYLSGEYGIRKTGVSHWEQSHKPFHWFCDFHSAMERGGFDVVLGNPPYVEKKEIATQYSLKGFSTESTNNLYAYSTERGLDLLRKGGRFGFIIPLSSLSTEKFEPLQTIVMAQPNAWLSHFDDRPAKLFDGLEHIQLTIVLARAGDGAGHSKEALATRCMKWSADERALLFNQISYVHPPPTGMNASVPKIGSTSEEEVLTKIWASPSTLGAGADGGNHHIYYTRKVHAFLNIMDFVPEVRDDKGNARDPSEQKTLQFSSTLRRDSALALLNSTLFRWFLTVFSDCRNLNKREVLNFPVDLGELASCHGLELSRLSRQLMASLRATSEFRVMKFKDQKLRVQCIIPRHSKHIIDQIDEVLARYYGFSENAADFITNFDIKYRLRANGDED